MSAHLRANLWLLVLTVLLCSVLYPLILLGIGQTVFHDKAQGSLLTEQGHAIGSQLIAQPFTADEYFQPRPSATSPAYNAAASGGSNWAGSNYLLRDRVARQLGPIVKYASGPKKGHLVGDDIQSWFQKDKFKDQSGKEKSGIVAQWAALHSTVAQNWIKGDKLNTAYVADWQKAHAAEVAQWIKDNPGTPEPKPEDLTAPFFTDYSKAHPGTFPSAVEHKKPDGKTEKKIEPVKEGADIQAGFFDMWLQEHPDEDLEPVPADMVTASGSGLDPDITLSNALWQLDRVAAAWAKKTGTADEKSLHDQIEQLLRDKRHRPLGGLVGVPLVNVLDVNLALRDRYQKTAESGK
jgi:K+-transporting ATPase ATPase C chain